MSYDNLVLNQGVNYTIHVFALIAIVANLKIYKQFVYVSRAMSSLCAIE